MFDRSLSSQQQQELAERLVELAGSGMPLDAGLEAAARETSSRRLRRVLTELASQTKAGVSWQDIFIKNQTQMPAHLLGLIQAGIRSGSLGQALDDLVDHQRMRSDLWRRVWWALSYPLTLVVGLALLMVLVMIMVVRPMKSIFEDFGTELPMVTQNWMWLADLGVQTLTAIVAVLIACCLMIRLFGGRIMWIRFLSAIPLFGQLLHWSGVTELARLLKILLARGIPLPEALELAATGVSNANLADVSQWLAQGTAAGIPLSELINATPRIPASVVPVVRWGEQTGALDEAMESVAEMFDGRIRLRASVLITVIPPICFIGIAAGAVALIVGLFTPLVQLLQNLA